MSNSTNDDQAPHFLVFHAHPILAELSQACLDLKPFVQELETSSRAVVQRRSELLDGRSKQGKEERERRGLVFYGWVARLRNAASQIVTKTNAVIEVLNKVRKDYSSFDKMGCDHSVWLQLNIYVASAERLLKRALAAYAKSDFEIGDATLETWLCQLVERAGQKALALATEIPLLPKSDNRRSREAALMVAEVITGFEKNSGMNRICFSMAGRETASYDAAKLLRGKGWQVEEQGSKPGETQGLVVTRRRK